MTCATHNVILLNKKLDKESRNEVYIATLIFGVSVYDNKQSTADNNYHKSNESYKIRIPIDAKIQNGRTYLPETRYDELTLTEAEEYWTLHTEDIIIVCGLENIETSVFEGVVTRQQAEEMANNYGYQKELIFVIDYSDNTQRGSNRVKHWRIGGA